MADQHNVSARLDKELFNQLNYILEKYNRVSYGKVSQADVIRIAITELYLYEQKQDDKEDEKLLDSLSHSEAEEETATTEETPNHLEDKMEKSKTKKSSKKASKATTK